MIVDPIVFLKLHAHPVVKLLEEVPILGTTADRTTGVVGENAPHAVASLPEEQRGDRTWTTPKESFLSLFSLRKLGCFRRVTRFFHNAFSTAALCVRNSITSRKRHSETEGFLRTFFF